MKSNLILLRSLFAPWWNLKAFYIRKKYSFSKKVGLCNNYYLVDNSPVSKDVIRCLLSRYLSYRKFPIVYPVRSAKNNWDTTPNLYISDYGKTRRELLEYMIEHCDEYYDSKIY